MPDRFPTFSHAVWPSQVFPDIILCYLAAELQLSGQIKIGWATIRIFRPGATDLYFLSRSLIVYQSNERAESQAFT